MDRRIDPMVVDMSAGLRVAAGKPAEKPKRQMQCLDLMVERNKLIDRLDVFGTR